MNQNRERNIKEPINKESTRNTLREFLVEEVVFRLNHVITIKFGKITQDLIEKCTDILENHSEEILNNEEIDYYIESVIKEQKETTKENKETDNGESKNILNTTTTDQ